jgi:hypothetical protein
MVTDWPRSSNLGVYRDDGRLGPWHGRRTMGGRRQKVSGGRGTLPADKCGWQAALPRMNVFGSCWRRSGKRDHRTGWKANEEASWPLSSRASEADQKQTRRPGWMDGGEPAADAAAGSRSFVIAVIPFICSHCWFGVVSTMVILSFCPPRKGVGPASLLAAIWGPGEQRRMMTPWSQKTRRDGQRRHSLPAGRSAASHADATVHLDHEPGVPTAFLFLFSFLVSFPLTAGQPWLSRLGCTYSCIRVKEKRSRLVWQSEGRRGDAPATTASRQLHGPTAIFLETVTLGWCSRGGQKSSFAGR